ncbi:MAG: pyridoxal phosphate-dependent aminotransferase [Vallitaleaceae bacterium]|nr:pyridoxal phosphate-dependent aminotransferase [Vallitaleaceae bacterium]
MISNQMKELVAGSSMIRAMFEEGKRLAKLYGEDQVYDFSLGNPNVEPPESVKEAIVNIVTHESANLVHGYMNNSGYNDVRAQIAEYTNKLYGTAVTEEEIVMTCGAAGGLNIIFKSLLNPEEEVITFAPYFGEYRNYANNYQGKLVVVSPNPPTFQPNLIEFEKKITANTKIVIVNSPNNPTGVVYSEETIIELARIMERKEEEFGHPIYLVSDEPYREIVYDDVFVPYLLNYYKNTIVGYSYSKSLSLPGERIGYLVVHPELEDKTDLLGALNVANRILGFVNAPSLFQRVVAKTLGSEVDVSIYKQNRDVLFLHLTQIGFEAIEPEGAFYLFMKSPVEDDLSFCEEAKKFNLLLVPGRAFGCPGYVRLAYCVSYEKIKASLKAFDQLAKVYFS